MQPTSYDGAKQKSDLNKKSDATSATYKDRVSAQVVQTEVNFSHCVSLRKLGLTALNASNDNAELDQLLRRARICVGKLLAMDRTVKPTILNAVANKLTNSLRADGRDSLVSLRKGIAALTEAKQRVAGSSIEWIIAETTLVCLELTLPPVPRRRNEQLEVREQLEAVGEMIVQHANQRQLTALRTVHAWPYCGRNQEV